MIKNYKIIGLMLTRDDTELLNDWLNIHKKYFDKIFCLDGSIDNLHKSKEILLKHSVIYAHDNDYPNIKKRDHSLRRVVYSKIKEYINIDRKKNKNYDYWITLIHPDEFYRFNIRDLINKAYSVNTSLIKLYSCPNAPQKKEIEEWKKNKTYKVFKHFLYPGHIENRLFKYNENLYYDDFTHSSVIPHKLDTKKSFIGGKIAHFKICGLNNYFYSDGKMNNSCWSGISSHYPKNRRFNKPEDFIQDKGYNKYENNKIFKIEQLDIF